MANTRRDPVGYRPFRTQALLAEGLLPVHREGGDLERSIAQGFFHAAGYFGDKAQEEAARKGFLDGQKAALEGRTLSIIDHDYGIDPELTGSIGADGKPVKGGGPVADMIRQVAAQEGVDPETMVSIARIESGLNPNAKNPNSSAAGLFQFIDSTARQFGLANKMDPKAATRAAAKLAKANAAHLKGVLGRDPTPGELYLAHQQGAGGAAKLLANPNRRAADLVGMDAVRLNGGNAAMTAGEFAALWTRKVSGKKAPAPAAPAQTMYKGDVRPDGTIGTVAQAGTDPVETGAVPDAVSVAPADAGTGVTLSGGTARPTGRNTVYGRAYDKAMIDTYVNSLETEVESTTSAVFRKYRDDPAMMATAFDDLRKEFLKNHVFPEIGGAFEAAFTRKTGRFIDAAYEEADKRRREQDVADFNQATVDLETQQQQALQSVDMKGEAAGDIVLSQQATIDRHYDAAVRKGIMTPDAAQKAKAVSRRKAATDFYQKQAEGLDADGVKAMREAMKADFADGGIDGLDGDGFAAVDDYLARAERVKRAEAEQGLADIKDRGATMAKRIALGFDVNKDDMAKLTQDAAKVSGGDVALADINKRLELGRAVRDLPLDAAQAKLADMRKSMGDNASDADIDTLSFGESLLEAKRKALATDPVTYAEQNGLVADTGNLAEGDPATVIAARVRAGNLIAKEYGVPPRYLKAGEAKAIGEYVRKNPEQGAAMAAQIVAAGGDKAGAILAEFGDDAPVLAGAGTILASGGSPRAAEDAILGANPDIKVKRKADAVREEFEGTVGTALQFQPEDRKRLAGTASAIARKRIDDGGIDPDGEEAAAIHEQAIHEAAGGTFVQGVQFGGFVPVTINDGWFDGRAADTGQVLVPATIRADMFEDVIASVRDDDLAEGLRPRGGVARLAGLMPVAVTGGYAFVDASGAFLPDNGGRVFVLDIEAKRKALAPRVPGAFK